MAYPFLKGSIVSELLKNGDLGAHVSTFMSVVSDLGYSDYMGRLAIGRVANGKARHKDSLVCIGAGETQRPLKVSQLQTYGGLALQEVETAFGDFLR